MGLENLHYRHSLNLLVPHHVPSSARMHAYAKFRLPSSTHSRGDPPSAYRLAHQSTLFRSSRNFRSPGMKRNCTSDHYNDAFNDEIKKLVRYLADNFDEEDVADRNAVEVFHGVEDSFNVSGGNETRQERWSSGSGSFFPSKRDFLEPDFLGIKPDPPEWPGRAEFVMMDIQRKANSFDIPFSLRIIKKKRWQEFFVDTGDFSYCSVNKAFSSMVFMIRELQSYALCTRDSVCSEDLRSVSKDLNTSFVWLFQRVFAKTPNLMLYLMLLLANFTVQSMVKNTEFGISDRNGGDKLCFGSGVPNVLNEFSAPGTEEMTQEEKEEGLWKSLVEEASCVQSGSGSETVDITQQLGLSGTVEIEPDDYVEYSRTDLFYQLRLAEDPTSSLLLSNYAQFLCLVPHDYDRAEECFKRAVETEPQDAMALSHYADFLWSVRNDLWGAEERYQQAMAVEPSSHYHSSKYAAFLWNTGGIETCFLMDSSSDDKN